ncbi:MAG: hypothetical protein LLG00_12445 [Planctomycetaceae bacterium]|nr:hypothetical protein [Planctomycetaceae bacterium]
MKADDWALDWLLGTLGALLGGVVGCFVCIWVAEQGFYAVMLRARP